MFMFIKKNGNGNGHKDQSMAQPEELDLGDWKPTYNELQAYLQRDEELAMQNIMLLMKDVAPRPVSLSELRGSTLHSVDTLETVMSRMIGQGMIVETQGKYALPVE